MLEDFQTIFYCLVYFYLAKVILSIIFETAKQFIPSNWVQKYEVDDGKWAVVTGATDGIGLGFVQYLAENGCNVVLISRNEQKIKKRIEELKTNLIKAKKKIPNFRYVVADFKNCGEKNFVQSIVSQIADLPISILVNNVGTSQICKIDKYSQEKIVQIINVNCVSMAAFTNGLIPILRREKSPAIVNLSSFLGQNAAPYSCLYSSTKAFNTFFSEGISMEKQLRNFDILSVRPLFVESPLSKAKKGFFVPDRRQCARACMRELRWEYETNGYYIHRIIGIFSRLVPKFISRAAAKSPLAESIMKQKRPQ